MIKISADSTCDLSPEIIKAFDITIAPLGIMAGSETFHDGVDIFPTDIFRYVDKEGKSCKTAAVNVFEYQAIFQELLKESEAVLHICIGAEFSSCFQNAMVAAQDFKNVYVIDSRNLSTGSGHVVYDAALMAKQGLAPQEIVSRLKAGIPKVEASFVIDRLDYLHKGGRCSTVAKLGANLLQLKPCIEVIDGRMTVGKKYRGKFDACLETYVKDRLYGRSDIDYSRLFITHPLCTPETVAAVKQAVQRYAAFDEIIETQAGCTVSNHCGPNTLGILFKRK